MRDIVRTYHTLLYILLLGICSACTHNKRLEYALEFAGENRPELEKVLAHYKDSGQKYEAARFLIENMPRYYAYTGAELDSLKAVQTSIYVKKRLDENLKAKWRGFSLQRLEKVYDAKVITADYLIENIDLAFKAWNERTWNKHFSFDVFCEWILPYRIGNEPLERWRKHYYDKYAVMLDSLYRGNDIIWAADALMKVLTRRGWHYNTDLVLPHLGAMYLDKQCVGYCRETCDFTSYVMRSAGIPTGTDMLVSSPEGAGGHSWSVVKDTTGEVVYAYFEPLKRKKSDGREKGKVYRQCFGLQQEKLPGMWTDENVPKGLRNPYAKDVTAEYFGENEMEIELQEKACDNYLYLGVFSGLKWIPIDIMVPRGKKTTVKNVEPGVIYLPFEKKNSECREMGYPFKLTENGIYYYRPEREVQKVRLYRKYPMRYWPLRFMSDLVGGRFEASNTLDFKQSELLHQVVDTPTTNYHVVPCMPKQKYRYVRFTAVETQFAQLGELLLFRNTGEDGKIELKAVEGSEPRYGNEEIAKEKVHDGDFLTYFCSNVDGGYVTLDLGKPEHIAQLVYVPRNDDNFITPGDTYELFYQNGAEGWTSLGRQVPTQRYLDYDNVPVNALLWLRNLSRGKEEQLFRMENGKQVF